MTEQPAKPVVPTLDLDTEDSSSTVPRKKTFSDRVQQAGKSIKKIVTPRSRSSSKGEPEEKKEAVVVEKKDTAASVTAGNDTDKKESYAEIAKKAAKKALGMEEKPVVQEDKAPSRLANESDETKTDKDTKKGIVGGLAAAAILAVGIILSKASQKKPEPVVEKKKGFLR